jgi:hypothetical protein
VKPAAPNLPQQADPADRPDPRRPIPLVYVRESPVLGPPPLTRWQGAAVALFVLSFPVLLALVWWLAASR